MKRAAGRRFQQRRHFALDRRRRHRPVRVRQILFNILSDAVAKSPDDAKIHVTLGEKKGSLSVAMRHEVKAGADENSLAISLARRSVNLNGGALTIRVGKNGERRISATLPGAEATAEALPSLTVRLDETQPESAS